MSSLGSGTSVMDIPHPIVNVYSHRHTIGNCEILNFFGFACHHLRGMGFWSQFFVPLGTHTCAFEYAYLCLLDVKTCSGPFLSFSKPQSVLGMKVCFKVWFWRFSKKNEFLDHFTSCGGLKTAFWGLSTEQSGWLWRPKYAQKWPKRASKVSESPK